MTRLSELRAKIRATKWQSTKTTLGPYEERVPVLTDAEADAMLRELCKTVRDATRQHGIKVTGPDVPCTREDIRNWQNKDFIPGIDDEGGDGG